MGLPVAWRGFGMVWGDSWQLVRPSLHGPPETRRSNRRDERRDLPPVTRHTMGELRSWGLQSSEVDGVIKAQIFERLEPRTEEMNYPNIS